MGILKPDLKGPGGARQLVVLAGATVLSALGLHFAASNFQSRLSIYEAAFLVGPSMMMLSVPTYLFVGTRAGKVLGGAGLLAWLVFFAVMIIGFLIFFPSYGNSDP